MYSDLDSNVYALSSLSFYADVICTKSCPGPTTSPSPTKIDSTTPSNAARIVCSIFIASRMISGSPAETLCPVSTRIFSTFPGMGELADPCSDAAWGAGCLDGRLITRDPRDEWM
jgi:hypothetical protein